KYTLENFMVGLSNNLAYAAAQAVVQNPGVSYNPLFIYGGTGVGKTHLMIGIGNILLKKSPYLKIIYCSSERFTNDFIESIQTKRTNEFRTRYRSCDLLLIDDIQFISGRDSTQEEFFHTFNELQAKNTQIILTADRPPNEIQKLEGRLASRFQGGLMVDIQQPDFDTRVAILKAKCQERGEIVPERVLTLIAESMPTNARELEGKLIQILQTIKLSGQAITEEMVKNFLGQPLVSPQKIDHKKVLGHINQYFNLKMADITGPNRKKELVLPRQLAMYILYKECQLPYERIGEMLGGRDHTTIMHGVEKINEAASRDREIQRLLIEIKQVLQN
ncbi:chromosomal replication initiator protein DnaA, partial [Candidatus Daviesbacteria bacterium]|nr:chromosomal replication initiator protein DnaA [Candidatus Daviesbacteria bacterium]